MRRIRTSAVKLRTYLEGVIEDRRRNPEDDFISQLVRAEVDDESLTSLEVLSVIILTHFGGSETPSHLIGNSLIALSENPDTFAELRSNQALTPKVVEKSLRYWSPVDLVFQTAAQDIEPHKTEMSDSFPTLTVSIPTVILMATCRLLSGHINVLGHAAGAGWPSLP